MYTNVSVELDLARIIASQISNECRISSSVIDMNIYRMNASLRLFNCPKIDDKGIVNEESVYKIHQ